MDILFGIPNESIFDSLWALIHFLSGCVIGYALAYLILRMNKSKKTLFFLVGFTLLVLWEVLEAFLRYFYIVDYQLTEKFLKFIPSEYFEYESYVNIAGDIIIGSIGLILFAWLYIKYHGNKNVAVKN